MNFTDKIKNAFAVTAEITVLKKGDFLLREGQIENYLYWIEEGAVKLTYISEHGEKIIRLGYAGSMINSLSSFLTNNPSEFCIDAIRKTKVRRLTRKTIQSFADECQNDYSKFLETLLVQQIDREVDLLIDSPAMRLERVLQRSPDLFQHVPLKYIASYLRMNAETLSRIRNS